MNKGIIEKLAEDHWNYVKGILEVQNDFATCLDAALMDSVIEVIGYHYKTAFKHGFKHGEQKLRDNNPCVNN